MANIHMRKCSVSSNHWGFSGGSVVKHPPANAGAERDAGSVPESGKYPGLGNGNPLQYSYLENFMDRGAWWAEEPGGLQSMGSQKSRLQLSTYTSLIIREIQIKTTVR